MPNHDLGFRLNMGWATDAVDPTLLTLPGCIDEEEVALLSHNFTEPSWEAVKSK